MAKGIYVGVDSKARKVKKAYIGVAGISRKIKKGYIGVNGRAQQFYSAETLMPFSSNPAPTSWTSGSDGLTATATNNYGTWTISTSQLYTSSESYKLTNAFDGNEETYFRTGTLTSTSICTLRIDLPDGILIKPDEIRVRHSRCGNSKNAARVSAIMENGNEASVGKLTVSSDTITETFNPVYASDYYFKAFIIEIFGHSTTGSANNQCLYEFEITSGAIKILD